MAHGPFSQSPFLGTPATISGVTGIDKMNPVPQSLAVVDKELCELEAAVKMLSIKIEPVLEVIGGRDGDNVRAEASGPPGDCPLACQIQSVSRRISSMHMILADISRRIQV